MQMRNAIKNALVFIALFPFKFAIRTLAIVVLSLNVILFYIPLIIVESVFGWRKSPLAIVVDCIEEFASRLFDLSDL